MKADERIEACLKRITICTIRRVLETATEVIGIITMILALFQPKGGGKGSLSWFARVCCLGNLRNLRNLRV